MNAIQNLAKCILRLLIFDFENVYSFKINHRTKAVMSKITIVKESK